MLEPVRFKDPEFDTKGNRIYSADDLSYYPILKYRQFPEKVGELMRRWNLENEWCRGASGNYPETYHACNRREILGWRIEKMGYCWGSAKANRSEAERHWIKCVDQPDYDPNAPVRKPSLYSNAEIEESTGLPSNSEIGMPP